MEISDAAIYFDNDPITDGYSGASLFEGQTASFDDSSSDGATNRRRVLSLAPGLSMPTRRVIAMYGDRWLVGTGTPDGFQGSVIRQHFTMKRVTDAMALLTPSEALAVSAGTPAYAQKVYFKDTVNNLTDSEYDTFWNIFVAPGEPVVQGTLFKDAASRLYRVRNTYLPVEGLLVCQSDALDLDAFQSCVFTTGTWDPVTETNTAGTTTVNGIWMDTPKLYRFRHISDEKIQPGDRMVLLPNSLTLKQGMKFTMQSVVWQVETFQPELDAQVALVRRA